MRKVCLLGASGSIGTQTLDVIKKNPSDFELVAFSVGRQTRKIRKIVKDFPSVKYICVKKNQQKKYYEAQYPMRQQPPTMTLRRFLKKLRLFGGRACRHVASFGPSI